MQHSQFSPQANRQTHRYRFIDLFYIYSTYRLYRFCHGFTCKSADACLYRTFWIPSHVCRRWVLIDLCLHQQHALVVAPFEIFATTTEHRMHEHIHRICPILPVCHRSCYCCCYCCCCCISGTWRI